MYALIKKKKCKSKNTFSQSLPCGTQPINTSKTQLTDF